MLGGLGMAAALANELGWVQDGREGSAVRGVAGRQDDVEVSDDDDEPLSLRSRPNQ